MNQEKIVFQIFILKRNYEKNCSFLLFKNVFYLFYFAFLEQKKACVFKFFWFQKELLPSSFHWKKNQIWVKYGCKYFYSSKGKIVFISLSSEMIIKKEKIKAVECFWVFLKFETNSKKIFMKNFTTYLSTAPVVALVWFTITAALLIEINRFFPDPLVFSF